MAYQNEKYVEQFQSMMHDRRGQASVLAEELKLPVSQVLYACCYLRGLDGALSDIFTTDVPSHTGVDFYWEFTEEHKEALRQFYQESGFKRNDICALFNIPIGSATDFFRRHIGVLRKQGNAYRNEARQIIKHKLALDMRMAFTDTIHALYLRDMPETQPSVPTTPADSIAQSPKKTSWFNRLLGALHVR